MRPCPDVSGGACHGESVPTDLTRRRFYAGAQCLSGHYGLHSLQELVSPRELAVALKRLIDSHGEGLLLHRQVTLQTTGVWTLIIKSLSFDGGFDHFTVISIRLGPSA